MNTNTTPQKHVLVTDAYSASNIGDLELVRLSLAYAKMAYPKAAIIGLAVDPNSFPENIAPLMNERIFPRLKYLKATRARKMLIAVEWFLRILFLTLMSFLPKHANKAITAVAVRGRLLPDSVALYLESQGVVAVGGGYLGDQYKKDTFLTVWTWWWATKLGLSVETMPISIEVRGRLLQKVLRVLGRSVKWRVRDAASEQVLAQCGLSCVLLPDLAFANFSPTDGRRLGTAVALVGSDYLSEEEQEMFLGAVVAVFTAGTLPTPVKIVAMHSPMSSTRVGGDHEMSTRLRSRLISAGLDDVEYSGLDLFSDVRKVCEGVDVVLSARMHAGIAGLCAGARVGLLAYETKHFALMRDLGLSEFVIDARSIPADFISLAERLRDAEARRFQDAAERYAQELARAEIIGG